MDNFKDAFSDYIFREFRDKRSGGLYASVNRDGIVTSDKLLSDMALALIVFSQAGDAARLDALVRDLRIFKDPDNEGFFEILDATGVPHPVGVVKTAASQALTGYGMYGAGEILHDDELKNNGKRLAAYTAEKYYSSGYCTRFDGGWKEAIDKKMSAVGLSAVLLSLMNTGNSNLIGGGALDMAGRFYDGGKGAFSYLYSKDGPDRLSGKSLGAMSAYCIALIGLCDMTGDKKYADMADGIVAFIDIHMRHTLFGGFWNICKCDGTVTMDPVRAYYDNGDSPFPYKSIKDEAIFLIAVKKLLKYRSGENRLYRLRSELVSDLERYYDFDCGGLSMGKGCWFTSPTDPTVPLARQVMVPPHTVGAFCVGNTSYVPLHQKQASLQLLGMAALGEEEFKRDIPPLKEIGHTKKIYDMKLDYISSGTLNNSYISTSDYLNWLNKTRSGMGYGLTPYKSPLGLRSDRSHQNFSILHAVSDLTVLKEKIPDRENVLRTMYACQNKDGGFGEQPSLLSELFTTYCVVLAAYILGGDGYDKGKCVQFLKACQNSEGCFGNAPGYPGDVWHTNLGVLALNALGEVPGHEEQAILYLLNCHNCDGGYGLMPGRESDAFSTFRAVDSLMALNTGIPDKKLTVNWVRSLQDRSGGFKYKRDKGISFVGSYHAIAALYIMGSLPKHVEQCKKWIASHQMKDGGFSRSAAGPSDTTDEGFIANQESFMLEKKLNPVWVALLT